jgi:hypothetical protein
VDRETVKRSNSILVDLDENPMAVNDAFFSPQSSTPRFGPLGESDDDLTPPPGLEPGRVANEDLAPPPELEQADGDGGDGSGSKPLPVGPVAAAKSAEVRKPGDRFQVALSIGDSGLGCRVVIDEFKAGLRISEMTPGSAIDRTRDIVVNDIIHEINGTVFGPVSDMAQLVAVMKVSSGTINIVVEKAPAEPHTAVAAASKAFSIAKRLSGSFFGSSKKKEPPAT